MSHTKKPENTITLKKAELREEMAHYHKHQWQALKGTQLKVPRVRWSYLSEEKYWEPDWHHWELVSLFYLKGNTWAFLVFVFVCWGGFVAVCATGYSSFLEYSNWCTKTSFIQDCHHRHDERSTEAKKKTCGHSRNVTFASLIDRHSGNLSKERQKKYGLLSL